MRSARRQRPHLGRAEDGRIGRTVSRDGDRPTCDDDRKADRSFDSSTRRAASGDGDHKLNPRKVRTRFMAPFSCLLDGFFETLRWTCRVCRSVTNGDASDAARRI